jgi:hypothetical protein
MNSMRAGVVCEVTFVTIRMSTVLALLKTILNMQLAVAVSITKVQPISFKTMPYLQSAEFL